MLARRFGVGLSEFGEFGTAAGLLSDVGRVLLRGLGRQRARGAEDDDLAKLCALREAIVLLLALVAFAELLVGEVLARSQLVAEDLVRDDLVAHARFHVAP